MRKPLLLRMVPPSSISQSLLDAAVDNEAGASAGAVTIPGMPGVDNPRRDIPVVLLHGTMDSPGSWSRLAEAICAAGRTVVLPAYGQRGTASVAESVAEIQHLIAEIVGEGLGRTNADCVDIVGHSQGGLLAYLLVENMILSRGNDTLPQHCIRRVVSVSGSTKGALWPRPFSRLGYRAAWLAGAFGGPAMQDQISLAGRVARQEVDYPLAHVDAAALPEWISIVSAGDGIVSPSSALSTTEYPGARTLTTEETLGRSIMHWLQQRDPEMVQLILTVLEEDSSTDHAS